MITVVHLSGETNNFVRALNGDGEFWNVDTQAFESWDADNIEDYAISLSEVGASGVYVAGVPPVWPAGTYTILFHDPSLLADPIASGTLHWDGEREVAPELLAASFDALQTHGDDNWGGDASVVVLPITSVTGTNEVKKRRIFAFQHADFPTTDFAIRDSQIPPQTPNLSGHVFSLVVQKPTTGEYLWQLDDCEWIEEPGIVRVHGNSQHMGEHGNFDYRLWDSTDNRVIGAGELVIEPAAAPASEVDE